ncbi:MAG: FAD-dependent monooxygenase [Gemmatimonadota bacterium]
MIRPAGGGDPHAHADAVVDAVVIGAGPAGALAARGLALGGASVILVERYSLPRRKVCGACVGPAAMGVLREAGLSELASQAGATPLESMRLVAPGGRQARIRLGGGVAWSRSEMDASLVREAAAAGVRVWTDTHARVGPGEGAVRIVEARRGGSVQLLRARVVVDAAGLGGAPPARDSAAGEEQVAPGARIGLGTRMAAGARLRLGGGPAGPVPPGRIDMVVGRSGYVGLVRLADGTLNVAAAVKEAVLRAEGPDGAVTHVLGEAGAALEGEAIESWKGTPPLTRASERVADRRRFLVGDAMGYVEPFTGEGMGWAMASAQAVVPLALRAVAAWDPGLELEWEQYRKRSLSRSKAVCRTIAWGLRRPGLVRMTVSAVSAVPGLADPVVRMVGRRGARL